MVKKILITGGTGLIGRKLTQLLLESGYQVAHVSRSKNTSTNPPTFAWDLNENYLDPEALNGVEAIINLAGASVADKKWSESYKKVILESRVKSTNLLFERLQKADHQVKVFLSASAVGIYPDDRGNQVFYEDGPHATNFLAEVTGAWEQEVDKIATLGIRTVKFRIGVVLSKSGGALSKMLLPIKLGLGAPLGSGQQYMSWIHELDLCRMFVFALENENLKGVYNAVSPEAKTNDEFSKAIAKSLNKPYFLPNIPGFLIKLMMGEMAGMVLGGNNVSCKKIQNAGFQFKFGKLNAALGELLVG
ncbi:TIGR01777 family oxidoreductase [Fulvivirgaceae bacterium BMA12]|uniref:TIGR01777 family oxidoreductase n=1 Tax=Agaribacillus aureus TaxID=3051825 RepID=A0ABT8LHM7_9BACT|nr:TIGR01777 family oxidoreductase [Fulvivirgaceae bacterium BMA12]